MKKTALFIALILFCFKAISQTPGGNAVNKEYYMKKSKNQKTIAWIMAGGGVALAVAGFVVGTVDAVDDGLSGSDNNNAAGTIMLVAGTASALGSIPLFISASKNKKKAMSLSFDVQRLPMMSTAKIRGTQFQPAATLHIPL